MPDARIDGWRRQLGVLTVAGALVVISGCAGEKKVPQRDVEKETARVIETQFKITGETVTCPGDLKARVGTTMTCTLVESDKKKHQLKLTVDTVKGDRAHWKIFVVN